MLKSLNQQVVMFDPKVLLANYLLYLTTFYNEKIQLFCTFNLD